MVRLRGASAGRYLRSTCNQVAGTGPAFFHRYFSHPPYSISDSGADQARIGDFVRALTPANITDTDRWVQMQWVPSRVKSCRREEKTADERVTAKKK